MGIVYWHIISCSSTPPNVDQSKRDVVYTWLHVAAWNNTYRFQLSRQLIFCFWMCWQNSYYFDITTQKSCLYFATRVVISIILNVLFTGLTEIARVELYTTIWYVWNEIKCDKFVKLQGWTQTSGVTTMGSDRENPGAPNPNGPNGGLQA
jgi:hypothetical protein